jgi:hypothetical protein
LEFRSASGPHGHGLVCVICDRHRGWLPKAAADFVAEPFGISAFRVSQ